VNLIGLDAAFTFSSVSILASIPLVLEPISDVAADDMVDIDHL
jgi:hypothetical protein